MIIQLLAVLICSALAASQLAENDTVVDNDLLGDNIIEDEANQTEHVLRFLLLGDWGKGGSTGQYGSSITTDDDQNSSRSITLAADNKNNNNNGGGGGGGNKNNNKKVFYQIQIAKSMATFATIYHPSFVVALGDNFYNNGVSSTSDILWSYLWKDVYLPYPDLNIPWYPVFGNHDYAGGMTSVRAEIQRTYEHLDDDTWSFPSTNYTKIFYSGTEALLQIIFIDTTTLAPSINKCCNENG